MVFLILGKLSGTQFTESEIYRLCKRILTITVGPDPCTHPFSNHSCRRTEILGTWNSSSNSQFCKFEVHLEHTPRVQRFSQTSNISAFGESPAHECAGVVSYPCMRRRDRSASNRETNDGVGYSNTHLQIQEVRSVMISEVGIIQICSPIQ